MKKFLILALLAASVAGVLYYYYFRVEAPKVTFKTAHVAVKDIVETIEATGTVEPEDLVDVGARVSGEIIAFGKDKNGREVDYGSEISEGDVIALIDDQIQQSNFLSANALYEQAKAVLSQTKADLVVLQTNLRQAERDWARAKRLGVSEALSQSAYDSYLSAWEKANAQIDVGKSKVLQAAASVENSQASLTEAKRNLEYCVIKAPVNGVVIDRKVNVGQTVVSNMSASTLFSIAKDLKRMEVWASVNEADIGGIKAGQRVTFTVDAFPNETFVGKVEKIRLNASMSQNVVTYVVEVFTDNSSGRLLPYLSANLSFEISRKDKTLAVPNAALRLNPSQEYVAEGAGAAENETCVWVKDDEFTVRPIIVKTGITDGTWTAVESPELSKGTEIVVGIDSAQTVSAQASNPFMPKIPQRKKQNTPPPEGKK